MTYFCAMLPDTSPNKYVNFACEVEWVVSRSSSWLSRSYTLVLTIVHVLHETARSYYWLSLCWNYHRDRLLSVISLFCVFVTKARNIQRDLAVRSNRLRTIRPCDLVSHGLYLNGFRGLPWRSGWTHQRSHSSDDYVTWPTFCQCNWVPLPVGVRSSTTSRRPRSGTETPVKSSGSPKNYILDASPVCQIHETFRVDPVLSNFGNSAVLSY